MALGDEVSFARVTIVGAGLAGLSAAVQLVGGGRKVQIFEAAAQAGGRCRSYYDPQLGLTIDNGNHLVLAGNSAVARFRARISALKPLSGPSHADFDFADLRDRARWTIRVNDGWFPFWIFARGRRAPHTRALDYLRLARLFIGSPSDTLSDRMDLHGPAWERLIEPVLLAMLNTPPETASARLASAIIGQSLLRGGKASAPRIGTPTLSAAFINPAVDWLAARGARVHLGTRLRAIASKGDRVAALDWGSGLETVADDEAIVLAVPPWVATALLPGISAPDEFQAIVNGHFATRAPAGASPMLGLLGATAQWLFAFENRISATVSAADAIMDLPREKLARQFWKDIQRAYGFTAKMPPWQVVKEKRATFAATPEQDAKRPQTTTRWRNLFLAGDWVQTGLPATIEGALRSGETAAQLVASERRG